MRSKLDEVLGSDVAGDLMESLPPFDWTQIATKDDLQLIHGRLDNMDRRFDLVDQRLDNMDRRFDLVDQRFDNVDQRFDNVNQRFDNMDRRFDLLDKRVGITMLKMNIASTIVLLGAMSGLLALFD